MQWKLKPFLYGEFVLFYLYENKSINYRNLYLKKKLQYTFIYAMPKIDVTKVQKI